MMKLSSYSNWDKFEVCRLGVNHSLFAPTAKPDQAIKTVLSVGRLCPAKGQHILLLAMKKVFDAGQQIKLVLVGDGEDAGSLKSLCLSLGLNEYVEFTGSVNHDEVHRFYQQADIFCLPSFAEGIPIVLMEAMAQEIVCVTTRITGIPELIDDGVDGVLVAASSVDELCKALLRLIEDDAHREKLGRAARQKIIEHYDVENNTDYYAERLSAYLSEDSA